MIKNKTEMTKRILKGKDGVERTLTTTFENKVRNNTLSRQSQKTAAMVIYTPKQLKGFFSKAIDSKNKTWIVAVARSALTMLLRLKDNKKAEFINNIPLPPNASKNDKQRAFLEMQYIVGSWAGRNVDTVVDDNNNEPVQIPETMQDDIDDARVALTLCQIQSVYYSNFAAGARRAHVCLICLFASVNGTTLEIPESTEDLGNNQEYIIRLEGPFCAMFQTHTPQF